MTDIGPIQPLKVGPVLVLTGANPAQQIAFHDDVPVGSRLRLFGAAQPGALRATNYHRWSNNAWSVVEPEGQNNAGDWTREDNDRLRKLVDDGASGGVVDPLLHAQRSLDRRGRTDGLVG